MMYQFGQELTKDPFGKPVCVGDVVYQVSPYEKRMWIYYTIIIGYANLKTKESLRCITAYIDQEGNKKAYVSWTPEYSSFLLDTYDKPKTDSTSYERLEEYIHASKEQRKDILTSILPIALEPAQLKRFGLLELTQETTV